MIETERVPIAIIGGGVIGLCIALKIAKKMGPNAVYLFERHGTLGEEQSSRNSGVIHSGIYYEPGSLKAELCITGKYELEEFCKKYDVPYAIKGKFVLAENITDEAVFEFYRARAMILGISGVHQISGDKIKYLEPNISARSALFVPSSGVIDVSSYIKTLETLALNSGVTILKRSLISNIEASTNGVYCNVIFEGGNYDFKTDILINAAGLNAAKIAKLINIESPYEIQPILGEYAVFNQPKFKNSPLRLSGMNIYPTPKSIEKGDGKYLVLGVHLTPTFEMDKNGSITIGQTVLVGPTADLVDFNYDLKKRVHNLKYFLDQIRPILPALKYGDLSLSYAGVRAKLKSPKDDFVIAKDPDHSNCFHVMADSPGLTSSISIAKYLWDKVM